MAFFFLQRYPKMLLSKISLLSTTGENDGGDRDNWCLRQVYQFSFPAPSPTLALTLVIWGTGEFVALSVSCVMEWNISLAIFLAMKCVLCLEAIFSVFCPLGKLLDGGRPFSFLIQSTGPRPLVLDRAGLASAATIEPDCWAGDCWVGVVFVDLGSTALGFIYLGSCAATEPRNSGMSLTWFRAKSSGRHVILQRTLQLDCQIGRP
jgi:hypothetical protein